MTAGDDVTVSVRRAGSSGGAGPLGVRVVVVEGPDRGRELCAEKGTLLVGTREDCDLALTDPTVSRRHAALELLGRRVRLRDLGSKNGTFYLGARVQDVEVPVGATFRVGETSLALLPPGLAEGMLSQRVELAGMIGAAPRMRRLFAEIEQFAASDVPVLVQGETGTGKELVARALHSLSPRAAGPLEVFDCGAVQSSLVQSALFGHARGSFTGAVSDAAGSLERAGGGTLFLDEVGELPLDLQPVLLRALETHAFRRLGETRERSSDFRLVCATHRDLAALVAEGRFRLDLFHRLAAVVLHVPALRERREDIPALAARFAREAGRALPPEEVAALSAREWRGNVRELRNAVWRGAALAEPARAEAAPAYKEVRRGAVGAFERSYLEGLLAKHQGSVSAAAREAGVARSHFYRLLEKHGLKPRS